MAEARTAAALEDLKRSLGAIDARLGDVERVGGAPQVDLKFEALAQVLSHRVEAVRSEVAETLQSAAGPQVEARLAAMAEHIQAAERRSAKAVEEIGRQVLSMAEAVGRKLGEVDQRGADAIDQVGTEVARIAGAVELRLARAEHAQAEAFQRLEVEMARVAGRMAPPATDLADPEAETSDAVLAPPPEPEPEPDPEFDAVTAALLEEARQKLAEAPEPGREEPGAPFGAELFSRAEFDDTAPDTAADAGPAQPFRAIVEAPWRRLDLDVPDADIPEIFAPLDDADEELFEPVAVSRAPGPQLSTREVIDRARAAARAAGPEQPVQMRARVESRATTGRFFQGFGPARPARRANTAMQTALMVAGGAAFLSVGAAGLTLMQGPAAPPSMADASGAAPPRAAVALSAGHGPEAPLAPPVFARVKAQVENGAPGALARLKALADAGGSAAQLYLAQLYDGGEAGLPRDIGEARRLTALSAEAGEPQAMHNLGVYFFRGEGGAQDLASAAQWFRKAAAAGVVESQYNLGLLYQSGSGVRRDLAQARYWFGQAAERGDAEARSALAELAPRPTARVTPARNPAVAAAASAPGAAASQNVRQTQLVLARLGYYEGPADGLPSSAYRTALAEYQRDLDDRTAGPRPYAAAQR